jgi:hypothetical protein
MGRLAALGCMCGSQSTTSERAVAAKRPCSIRARFRAPPSDLVSTWAGKERRPPRETMRHGSQPPQSHGLRTTPPLARPATRAQGIAAGRDAMCPSAEEVAHARCRA